MNNVKLEVETEFDRGTDEEMEVLQAFVDDLNEAEFGKADFAKKKSEGKAVDAIDWNQVIITLIGSTSVLAAKAIHSWLSYKKGRKVKIGKKEYTGYSPEEIKEIEKVIKRK